MAEKDRCTYSGCDKPNEIGLLHHIGEGWTAGGRDWNPLVGNVLCETCYKRFLRKGTLEKSKGKLPADTVRRCTYANCEKPDDSTHFYHIGEGKTAGGRDWGPLHGNVLCHTCHTRFMRKGTLEVSQDKPTTAPARHKSLAAAERRCTYAGCEKPEESRKFIQIGEGTCAGGRDWSSLIGSVLCESCYTRFLKRGALERYANKPLAASAKKCSYAGCEKPEESSHFYQIGEGNTAEGRDWSSLAGSVLCHTCYNRFRRTGDISKQPGQPPASEQAIGGVKPAKEAKAPQQKGAEKRKGKRPADDVPPVVASVAVAVAVAVATPAPAAAPAASVTAVPAVVTAVAAVATPATSSKEPVPKATAAAATAPAADAPPPKKTKVAKPTPATGSDES